MDKNMRKFSIKDSLFSHAYSSSGYNKPSYFEWDRNNQHGDVIFLTDSHVFEVDTIPSNIKKYAWLLESPSITPNSYEFVYNNSKLFDKIFTHSKKILDNTKNSYFSPTGGCFLKDDEIKYDYEKTKLISMMISKKRFTDGQNLRHQIANKYGKYIDLMGRMFDHRTFEKIDSCRDYAFSIVVENCKEDYYFTEKIIDCLLTGTVPIYWGCPSIDKFFDKKGMITIESFEELESIITDENYLISFYTNKSNHIINNFELALNYKTSEDYIYVNYLNQ